MYQSFRTNRLQGFKLKVVTTGERLLLFAAIISNSVGLVPIVAPGRDKT